MLFFAVTLRKALFTMAHPLSISPLCIFAVISEFRLVFAGLPCSFFQVYTPATPWKCLHKILLPNISQFSLIMLKLKTVKYEQEYKQRVLLELKKQCDLTCFHFTFIMLSLCCNTRTTLFLLFPCLVRMLHFCLGQANFSLCLSGWRIM